MTEPRKNSSPPEPETPEGARAKIRSGQGYGLSDVILAYAEYASGFDMNEEQQEEFVSTIWSLAQSFIAIELGIDPMHLVSKPNRQNKFENETGTDELEVLELSSFARELIMQERSGEKKEVLS